MGIRKNYRNLTDAERQRLVQALHHVKSTGFVDQFVEIHERHFFHNIHISSHFLPWHREMLLRFERELQAFHPDITIPYWDSTVDRSPSNRLWNNNFLGQFNSAWGLNRALGAEGRLPTQQQVEDNQGRDNYGTFWPELENPIHNGPHIWVGGVMARTNSPGDPVFYLHHCWIDLLWAKWQHSHPGAPFVSSQAGAGLNDPLLEWPDRTPADVLDHHALGYRYDVEPPEGGRIMIADFSGGQVPAQVRYWENWGEDWDNWGEHPLFNGWQDDNDWQLVGDFMKLGHDQLLSVNRTDAGDGRIMIADFSGGQVPAQVRYWENWGQHPLFNGWQDDNDLQFVGDFMRLGYDQLLSVNREGSGGRIMVADFSGAQVPPVVRYWEDWGEHPLFNGWQDDNDWQLVGDFMHLGHDQLLSVNRTDAGDGRIMIADFSAGQVPAQVRYWENWSQHPLFNGWQDDNDLQFVGDFMKLGYDQLLSVNRTDAGDGRIMIADFSGGQVPAQVRYWENWGQHPLFNGWQDDNDWAFVGDFMKLGYDQLLSVNRTDAGDGRIMLADFSSGQVPAQVGYWENWGEDPLFNGWQDDNDWAFVGDFMKLGHDQLLSVNRG